MYADLRVVMMWFTLYVQELKLEMYLQKHSIVIYCFNQCKNHEIILWQFSVHREMKNSWFGFFLLSYLLIIVSGILAVLKYLDQS